MKKKWDNIGDSRQPGDPNYTDSTHNPYGRSKVRYGHGASYRSKNAGVGQQDWHMQWLEQAYKVLQPNGIIKAFSGTRTYHRLAAAMEQAGFVDIRLEAWCYGSGFPKSLNIGKALDSEEAKLWDGWGTALKPAWEPVLVGRKPTL